VIKKACPPECGQLLEALQWSPPSFLQKAPAVIISIHVNKNVKLSLCKGFSPHLPYFYATDGLITTYNIQSRPVFPDNPTII
jgi:hypothetical protein